jgi:signal transduction histidine kinase
MMESMDRRAWALDATIAVAATATELALLLDDGYSSIAAVALTVAAGGALVLRRAAPLAALGATLAAAIAIVAIGEAPSGLCVLIALGATAAHCERRTSLAALAVTIAIVVPLSIVTADRGGRPASVVVGAVASAPLAAGIWAGGAYARAQRGQHAQLEREREQATQIAVHEERAAIARELHDVVAHSVGVMLLGVRGARNVLETAPAEAAATLARVEATGEQSVAELRRLLALLRDPHAGADRRPQPTLAGLPELVAEQRAAGLPVRLDVVGAPAALPTGVELSAYRIVQEAVTNAARHAGASEVVGRHRRAAARRDPHRPQRRRARAAADHASPHRARRRPHRAAGPGRRPVGADPARARDPPARRARALQRRDRGAARDQRRDGQEPRREPAVEARPARSRAGGRVRLRARDRRGRRWRRGLEDRSAGRSDRRTVRRRGRRASTASSATRSGSSLRRPRGPAA